MDVPAHGIQGYIAIFLFPLLSFFLFRYLEVRQAIAWTFLVGFLVLPAAWVVQVDLPLVPAINKESVPALSAAFFSIFAMRRAVLKSQLRRNASTDSVIQSSHFFLAGFLPRSLIGGALLLMMILAIVFSTLTNRDPLIFEERIITGHTFYDIPSSLAAAFISLIPLLLGRKFLANDIGHQVLLKALVIAALVYSLPSLYEIRMSPQINIMVYGFFQHMFDQHMRADGFRPIVFVDHGLVLGIFLAGSAIAAGALIRTTKGMTRLLLSFAVVYLCLVIFLAKVFGALLILLIVLAAVIIFPVRLQLLFALIVAITTLVYPLLRGAGLVPVDQVAEFARTIDPERAASLEFRLHFEDMLLEKANERPLFGWGGWGRHRLYDAAGNDISVTDGAWIIEIGMFGWVGYIGKFGLICLPIIWLGLRRRKLQVGYATSGLCLVASAYLIDQLPNDSMTPVFWLISGALLGRLEKVVEVDPVNFLPAHTPASSRYSRFPALHKR